MAAGKKRKTKRKRKRQSLDDTALDLRNEYGDIVIDFSSSKMDIEYIKCGIEDIDNAIGGGLPRGRMIELFGPESSGKTSISLKYAAAVQAAGGRVAIIDAEHALHQEWASTIGVDLEDRDSCILIQPDSGEQALNVVRRLVKKSLVDLIIIDSVAALVPEKELEREIGQSLPGAQARLISQACRILAGDLGKSTTIVLWINQIRHKVGIMFGNPEVTPGGNALKFYSSVRIDVRRKEAIRRVKKGVVGFQTQIKIVKNKVAAPLKVAMCVIDFEKGVRSKRKSTKRKSTKRKTRKKKRRT